jgi:pantetheine-phosphate adenylyltransferase
MGRIAVFPGSFDPVTIGHESIVLRALPLFDTVIVAIGNNSSKNYMFSLEKRKEWLKQTFAAHKQVQVEEYSGLTVDFCKSKNAKYILRGIRTPGDYEFESNIAQMNKMMQADLESIFMLTLPAHTAISSTIVRDILKHGGDVKQFIPSGIVLK